MSITINQITDEFLLIMFVLDGEALKHLVMFLLVQLFHFADATFAIYYKCSTDVVVCCNAIKNLNTRRIIYN